MLNKKKNLILGLSGVVMFLVGLCLTFSVDGGDVMSRLSSLVTALGCGIIGGSIGTWYKIKRIEKIPNKSKQIEIEYKDERNTLIRYKAKSIAGEITNWIVILVAYICIVMGYPTWLVFLILGVFLLKYILEIVFIAKYNKEL